MPMTFEEWTRTGRDVADLRDHEAETQYYHDDHSEPVPGRLYENGHMERHPDGRFWFCAGYSEAFYADLASAERALWNLHVCHEEGAAPVS